MYTISAKPGKTRLQIKGQRGAQSNLRMCFLGSDWNIDEPQTGAGSFTAINDRIRSENRRKIDSLMRDLGTQNIQVDDVYFGLPKEEIVGDKGTTVGFYGQIRRGVDWGKTIQESIGMAINAVLNLADIDGVIAGVSAEPAQGKSIVLSVQLETSAIENRKDQILEELRRTLLYYTWGELN